MEGQKIADGVRVFRAVQPVKARGREMCFGVLIDLVLQKSHERFALFPIQGGAAIRRRHQARAQLGDDFFPGLGIRRHVVEPELLEVQVRDLLRRVVAVEANPVNDGRLPLGFVANEAATGCHCTGQHDGCT